MMQIEGGRAAFYQWDVNQRLEVDNPDIREVHFTNAVTSPALVCEVYEENGIRYANVPNILLQQIWPIQAYGGCGSRVRDICVCKIIRRERPADYVYTETEVKSFDALEERIKVLEEGGTGGGGIATETDPTVPAWAKQPEKPTYTADEVGAASVETVRQLSEEKANTVRTTAQDLTEEQKAQARENIGAIAEEDFVITEYIPSINLFNPNTTTTKNIWGADYCISDVIPCNIGDTIYVRYLNDAGELKHATHALWRVKTDGTETAISANRLLEFTFENIEDNAQLLGAKIGVRGNDFALDEIGDRLIVTINSVPSEFEPWGGNEKKTNLLMHAVRYDEQELTETQKAQARQNIGALAEDNNKRFSKVLVIGDSISADYYGNYTKWVTMLMDEGFFPAQATTNDSIHATGFVARYNNEANDFLTRIEAVANKSTYDLVVVFGGINDFLQSIPLGESGGDKATEFKPAVDYFFDYLVNNFTQARIVVLSPLRTGSIYPNQAGNEQSAYTTYIRETAKKYCLPVLNLTEESGFIPFNDVFTDMWTFTGWSGGDGTQGDGVHPSEEYIRKFLAPMIKGFLMSIKPK